MQLYLWGLGSPYPLADCQVTHCSRNVSSATGPDLLVIILLRGLLPTPLAEQNRVRVTGQSNWSRIYLIGNYLSLLT
jgi:hypothetical protein